MCAKSICLSCLIAAGLVPIRPERATEEGVPEETNAVRGTNTRARPELAGTVVRDDLIDFEVRNAEGRVVFAGQVEDRVVRSKQRETLSFEFRIRNTRPNLPGRIKEIRRDGFAGWSADMDYRLDGVGAIGPDHVNRYSKGATVGFWFGKTPITPAADSRFCFVLTNAAKFDARAGSLVIIADDGSKTTLRIAAPKK
jgi:hypothetical protein